MLMGTAAVMRMDKPPMQFKKRTHVYTSLKNGIENLLMKMRKICKILKITWIHPTPTKLKTVNIYVVKTVTYRLWPNDQDLLRFHFHPSPVVLDVWLTVLLPELNQHILYQSICEDCNVPKGSEHFLAPVDKTKRKKIRTFFKNLK